MNTLFELFPPLDHKGISAILRPLLIAGMATPVQEGDGGINLAILRQFDEGLLVAIDPYLDKQEGDTLEVLWGGQVLDTYVVKPGEESERTLLFLDTATMVEGWVEEVLYRLTPSGGRPEDSIPLRLLINTTLPGDYDRDPHLPGHSQLPAPVLPEDVMENGVDAGHLEQGVEAKIGWYDNRALRDTIHLRWGTASLFHTVTEQEAAGKDPIPIIVDQATLLAAGDAPRLLVHYQVYDEVWNYSEDWSLQTHVAVDAGAWKLDPPIVKEALNGQLDLGDLGDKNATVQIEVRNPPFAYNDTVIVSWVTLLNDIEIGKHDETKRVENLPTILEVPIPNEIVREGAGGKIVASYVLHPLSGEPPTSSKRTTVTIVGEPPLEAPDIYELIGDRLDAALERAHVVVPAYKAMIAGDFVTISWAGTTAGGAPHLHEIEHPVTGNEEGQPFYEGVGSEHISLLQGGKLDVSYQVANDDRPPKSVRKSSHLKVQVAALPATLPAPTVDEAPDGVLDPDLHPGNVTLRVSYPGTRTGDILTWYWLGDGDEDSSAKDWIPITTALEGKPLPFPIQRRLVEANLHSTVRVLYTLKLASNGQYEYSKALDLVIGRLIGELPAPTVREAPGGTLDPDNAINGVTVEVDYPSMEAGDLITLKWLGTPGAGSPTDQEHKVTLPGKVPFKVPASVIGANIDRTVMLMYTVRRYERENLSDIAELTITALADTQLPSALITQAKEKILNLATFSGNATCTLATTWPFIAEGQTVWLYLAGKDNSGGDLRIDLLQGRPLTAAHIRDGISELVPRTELERLGQDTPLAVMCRVGFAENASEFDALPFPPTDYTFKLHHDWVVPTIERVEDADGEIVEGGNTYQNRVTLSGRATIESKLELFDGNQVKDQVDVDGDGRWTHPLSGLQPKAYVLTAHALDGSGNVSLPRTFEVLENLTPTIDDVRDSNGTVADGGTTIDTSLKLTGLASPERQVEIFDGSTSKGTANTDHTGRWSHQASGLGVATHIFKAKALYATGEESQPWRVIVAKTETPTLTSIRDSRREVPANGYTVDTGVTVQGTATANLKVEVFDNGQTRGERPVGSNGQWTIDLQTLAQGAHKVKAKALYGSNPESPERAFNVTADIAPNITRVLDPKNTAIPNGGETYANSVTVHGEAAPGQEIALSDNAGTPITVPVGNDGKWSRPLTGLALNGHSLKARALYGSGKESANWAFTVKQAVVPTVSNVTDSKGEVPQNGSTIDTTVTAKGRAAPNEQVEILDGAASKGTAAVNGNGDWSHQVTSLGLGRHNLKAVAQYGEKPASNVRTFEVKSPTPELIFNPSPVALNGRFYSIGHIEPRSYPANTQYTRTASGGRPPYTYTTNNAAVIWLRSNGTISSLSNGSATVTVRDAEGTSKSYNVTVSNCSPLRGFSMGNYSMAVSAAGNAGYRLPSRGEFGEMWGIWGSKLGDVFGHAWYWSSSPAGGIFRSQWCRHLGTGQEQTMKVIYNANIVGLR